ncbi:MAG: M1 family aminopeptidase [Bacteroidota bacterium]
MKFFLSFFFILTQLLTAGKKEETQTLAIKEYWRITSELSQLSSQSVLSSPIENISFVRDAATFTLTSGTLYQLPSLNNNFHALLFIGKGSATIVPPSDIEQKQLNRFFDERLFPLEFKTLFLIFTDSTFTELSRRCAFVKTEMPSDGKSAVEHSLLMFRNDDTDEFDFDILRPFLFQDSQEMFYAHFYKKKSESFFFNIDPYEDEEISFGKMLQSGYLLSPSGYRETIVQFHKKNTAGVSVIYQSGIKMGAEILHYSMDNRFANNLTLTSHCTISFINEVESRKWIPFSLYHTMNVDSIVWSDGKKADFVRLKESGLFWLYDSAGFKERQTYTMIVYSQGEIINRDEGWYSLKTSTSWYPHTLKYREKSTYDLKFSVPTLYQFTSIGTKVSTASDGDNTVTEWKLASPGRNASFMIGRFKEYTASPDSTPPITVYVSNAHDAQLKNYLSQAGVLSGKDMDKQVAGDIENSIRFFQHLYGKASTQQFTAIEIPGGHGEAFPGLVHLSWSTFQNTESDGTDEIFRAHEVAHQWWGIGVNFNTYHDQWLSEAFADYSGLWYMQVIIHDNEKFFEQLRKYKTLIMSNRKYLLGSGQEAGPIWLGYRTSSSSTEGDYSLIIYKKGAWVLHMLRNMALELKTMKEDVFQGMMKEFYQTNRGKSVSTADFQKITEKYFNIPMDWFFKQWVYNTEIPTYSILYKLQKQENGKYKVHCTVKQANVPDDFQMYVPFLIDFGEKRYARLRYLVKGPVTEFEFPLMPLKPEEIKFNDLESVLCEIEDEDWD